MVNRNLSGWSRLLGPALLLLLTSSVHGQALPQIGEVKVTPPGNGPVNVLVELKQAPAAVIYGNTLRQNAGLSKDRAQALAVSAAREQIQAVKAEQQKFDAVLAGLPAGAKEIYRVQKAYNGIAFQVDSSQVPALQRLPGVKAVHLISLEYPTNSTSVPFLGVPNVWSSAPAGVTGTGIRIGIIDTGIDYQHANFGGTGLLADYQANDTTVAESTGPATFPTAKVVGGTDLVGNAYNGNNTPVPDPDPMDCNGHGSHVAGTAAGFGVTAAGATYTGPYDGSAPFASLRIGPGVAPGASLYAIRVFGCTGGTGVVVAAIDWALDPNGDNDMSDHLDVINMSLGSDNGSLNDSSAQASENAAATGMIVVTSAGNAGDTYYIVGSPSVSSRTISTAAIVDSGIGGAALNVNSPPAIAGGYAASAANSFAPTPAPAPTGQTANIVLALDAANASGPLTTDGCTALTNAAAVAGNIALIDRGTCGFQVKANNAQAAGAIGVIIANNVAGDPNLIALGATGITPVTIPVVMISQADRNTIVAGLPANATLGAATAADTLASFSSRGPRRASSPVRLKPDIAAPGLNITSTQTGVTCASGCIVTSPSGFLPGNQALTISGTSMASPHMAGTMALMRQLHPDWSVEQLKALVMDYALHDTTIGANGSGLRYGPGRIGAGRVDPAASAAGTVVALNDDDTGVVSVSFDSIQVVGSATEVKNVRVLNTGSSTAAYDLSIVTYVDAPGIAFSLPSGTTVSVPAGGSTTIPVQMDATAAMMNHTREATVAPGQAAPSPLTSLGTLARHWLTEEAGYLVLSQGGTPKLHVPLYITSRPASTMAAPATIPTGGNPTGSTTIPLTGADVCTGTPVAGPNCSGTFPTTEVSLVTPFELQVVSPRNPALPNSPYADLQYAGVAYSAASNLLLFGVSTWGDWSSPTDVSFNIYIDANSDGTFDRVLFNSNPGTMALRLFGNNGATNQDSFITAIFTIATSGVSTSTFLNAASPASVDSALFNNNVMVLAATPASLGLPAGTTKFKYKIVTCPGFAPLCLGLNGFDLDEANGPFTYDYAAANQGLNFGGTALAVDMNGSSIPVTWNTTNMTNNGSLGALLFHHHNKAGQRAQTIALQGTPTTDLAITKSVAPANPTLGQNVTFTLTVSNGTATGATGVQVTDLLPDGLTYVSDDGGGAYDPNTGLWTVGAVAASGSVTLHVVATVDTTDMACNPAQITAVTPLDTNPANNSSGVCVTAPNSADVAVTVTSPASVFVGQTIHYLVKVTNSGADTAYSLNLQQAIPGFSMLPGTASAGSYNPATGLWNLASLGKGFTETLDIAVTAPNMAGPLTNQSNGTAGTADPNNANNTASAATLVLSPATIANVTKTVSGTFSEGGTITYTITIPNTSTFDQQDNPGHEFTDTLSPLLTLVSASASSGAITTAANTVNWDGVITAGGSVTITITALINNGAGGQTICNQGTVSFDADGNGTNESTIQTDDPGVGGTADPTCFIVLSTPQIPTLSPVGLALLALLLVGGALLVLRRRQA
ncbi:MAG TPA: IPTL-CTERM sorting domain-containing protein [Thermoanaerobaculia bacterium]|nr:IPTL-CTERM sorting domain-containing protein [Thermoanaerobaculia bacterium]